MYLQKHKYDEKTGFLPSSKGSLDKTLQRASSAYPVISESLLKRINQDVWELYNTTCSNFIWDMFMNDTCHH